jgi:hypothetical protein
VAVVGPLALSVERFGAVDSVTDREPRENLDVPAQSGEPQVGDGNIER